MNRTSLPLKLVGVDPARRVVVAVPCQFRPLYWQPLGLPLCALYEFDEAYCITGEGILLHLLFAC